MALARTFAIFGFNYVLRPLLRLHPLVLAVLALALFVVLGAAVHAESVFVFGVVGFLGLLFASVAVAFVRVVLE